MLKHKTVFVLGAGASIPYKFPSGAKLLAAVRPLSVGDLALQAFLHKDLAGQLRQALIDSQEVSLDALLETQPQEIQDGGKRLIARNILQAEHDIVRPEEEDWFSYLFSHMADGVTGQGQAGIDDFFARNDFVFVTYNYDRLVEYKLMSGLRAKYGFDNVNWGRVKARVIHLHGSIGEIDPMKQQHVPWGANIAGGDDWNNAVNALTLLGGQSIKIVHEPKPEADEFKRARALLSQAQRVFFLGFAFGRTNVDRLGFENVEHSAVVRFTCFGMTHAEMSLYCLDPLKKAKIGNYEMGNGSFDCLLLLRNYINALVVRY